VWRNVTRSAICVRVRVVPLLYIFGDGNAAVETLARQTQSPCNHVSKVNAADEAWESDCQTAEQRPRASHSYSALDKVQCDVHKLAHIADEARLPRKRESRRRQTANQLASSGRGIAPGIDGAGKEVAQEYQCAARTYSRGNRASEQALCQASGDSHPTLYTFWAISLTIDFIDHYFDLLTYLADRKRRLESFKSTHPPPPEGSYSNTRAAKAWKDYCGRERANLRKRRTKTKCNDFSILSQIGQGGYGQVFLARKKDTNEIVALKKMNVHLWGM
jgi:hypothetical protein